MRSPFYIVFFAAALAALFLFLVPREIGIIPAGHNVAGLPRIPEAAAPTSTASASAAAAYLDIEKQNFLANPPEVVKGIYVTAWSAGSPARMNKIIELIDRTELNAVVIDIKDFSGFVSYKTGIKDVEVSGAEEEIRIQRPNALIKKLHDAGIYVIARQTVFQDPILAKAHPEWALGNASAHSTGSTSPSAMSSGPNGSPQASSGQASGGIWTDHKGLAWMDPAAKPVWDYNTAIAKDALSRGFDEINFDYIRFASDGDLSKIEYPFWDMEQPRNDIIRSFFKYLRDELGGARISADLFGLSTLNRDDLGIGQVIEDAYEYFDYVSPMVYPSHYAKTFLGFQNPAAHPYEVVRYSMDEAAKRISATEKVVVASTTVGTTTIEQTEDTPKFKSKLRPWLQDFNLGAVYNADMVRAQIQAAEDSLNSASSSGAYYGGWFLWDPANAYTEAALQPE